MSLVLSPNLRRSSNPAQMAISGSISNGTDWVETITLTDQNGAQITGVGSDTFALQLRDSPDDTATDLSLTTTDGDLTVTVGGSSTTLAISGDPSGLDPGDYTIDIVSETSGGVSTHRAHGRISVFGSPIAI